MKKLLIVILTALLLCSCGTNITQEATETEPVTTASQNQSTSAQTEPVEITPKEINWNETMPKMDGSTSVIPLEAGAKAELLGITYNEALKLVGHTKTHEAFERMINGEVDLIMSVPLSEEQVKSAEKNNFEYESIPIALEGFVFVVNIDNPIDTLTSEQIRGIYSGGITNWKDVGGLDEPIVAYQRNQDSGSQNYMVEFMGDIPLMEVPSELVPGFMGGMMDAVSVYDNSRQAIGYSVYSYAAQMYANVNQVKFIKVDGIEPSKQTFSDKSYPLLSCTYIFFDKSFPDESNARLFAEWLTNEDGQLCVLKNGYVPVMDMEIPNEYLPYESLGTGAKKPSDYKPSEKSNICHPKIIFDYDKSNYQIYGDEYNNLNIYTVDNVSLDFLKDKEFEAEINTWIANALEEIKPYRKELDFQNEQIKWHIGHLYNNEYSSYFDLFFNADVINGYLSISMGYILNEPYNIDDSPARNYEQFSIIKTAVFDIIEKKKIDKLSDLFYEGVDFVPLLNNMLTVEILNYYEQLYPNNIKVDFSGLLGDVKNFTADKIFFAENNACFYQPTSIYYILNYYEATAESEELKDYMTVWGYRDANNYVKDNEGTYCYDNNAPLYLTKSYTNDQNQWFYEVTYSRFFNHDEIIDMNNDLNKATAMIYETLDYNYLYPRFYENVIVFDVDRYVFEQRYYVDRDTMKILTPDDLFKESYRENLVFGGEPFELENTKFLGFFCGKDVINLYYKHPIDETSYTTDTVELDISFLRERYADNAKRN